MGRESGAWAGLKVKLAAEGVKTRRLTDRLVAGVPDVLWVRKATGCTGLVETKAVEYRVVDRDTGGFVPDLSQDQLVWIFKWVSDGGMAGALVRCQREREWLYWPGRPTIHWTRQMAKDALACRHHIFRDPLDVAHLITVMADRTEYR